MLASLFFMLPFTMLTPTNPKTTPNGLWQYTESTGVRFKHHNLTALLGEIRIHRQASGLSTHGDWLERVYEAICLQNPSTPCHDKSIPERVFTADDVWRFLTTMKEKITSGEPQVSQEEQIRRAKICESCPQAGYIACRSCGQIGEAISELVAGRNLPPEAHNLSGKSCMICGCNLPSKIGYSMTVLRSVDAQLGGKMLYPSNCWQLDQA